MIKLGFIGTSAIAEKFAEAAALTGFYELKRYIQEKRNCRNLLPKSAF